MYNLSATINYPDNTEEELDVASMLISPDAVAFSLSKFITTNPDATSFVFVVTRMPFPRTGLGSQD